MNYQCNALPAQVLPHVGLQPPNLCFYLQKSYRPPNFPMAKDLTGRAVSLVITTHVYCPARRMSRGFVAHWCTSICSFHQFTKQSISTWHKALVKVAKGMKKDALPGNFMVLCSFSLTRCLLTLILIGGMSFLFNSSMALAR